MHVFSLGPHFHFKTRRRFSASDATTNCFFSHATVPFLRIIISRCYFHGSVTSRQLIFSCFFLTSMYCDGCSRSVNHALCSSPANTFYSSHPSWCFEVSIYPLTLNHISSEETHVTDETIVRRPADDGTALNIWETFVVVVKQLNICFTRLMNRCSVNVFQ